MTGDVNLTHLRDALNNVHQADDYGYVFGGSADPEAWAQLADAEAVIQAARALVDLAADDAAGAIDNIGEPTSDFESDVLKLSRLTLALRDRLAALEAGQ